MYNKDLSNARAYSISLTHTDKISNQVVNDLHLALLHLIIIDAIFNVTSETLVLYELPNIANSYRGFLIISDSSGAIIRRATASGQNINANVTLPVANGYHIQGFLYY